MTKGLRFDIGAAEGEALEAEALAHGYRLGEWLRVLVRLGRVAARRHGAIRRGDGLHFVEVGVDGRTARALRRPDASARKGGKAQGGQKNDAGAVA